MTGLLSRSAARLVVGGCVAMSVPILAPGCSIGDGSGSVQGVLDVPDCWSGPFNLAPTFFAADPWASTLTIRIQNGSDYATFSDGISILVDNVQEILGESPFTTPLLNKELSVSVPAGVAAVGQPVVPEANRSIVHATVYLDKSCPTQNVALYALQSVSLDAQGNCNPSPDGPFILECEDPSSLALAALADASADAAPRVDASVPDATPPVGAEAATVLPLSPPIGHSTITFSSIFDGDESDESAAERLTQGTFSFYLGDPGEACPGSGPPPPCRGFLQGTFQFYFERGQPGQPFP